MGNGTTAPSLVPAQVPGLSGVVDVAASRHAGMALRGEGWVVVWGHDFNQLSGEGPISATSLELFRIPGLREIGAGLDNGAGLQDNGRVRAWGGNSSGSVGTGSLAQANPDPAPVIGVVNASYVGSGPTADHAVVVQPVLTDFSLTLDPGAGSVASGGSLRPCSPSPR
ncbi:hypothetical protein GCM10009733_025930 [Nonomuraea maheshkhaliensis]|uniref:Uncharacterized protein n=1 Tax=Nonomuraea maheshkhaliensis TaxID=419590 RepID=A0ABP4R069_9ACTN